MLILITNFCHVKIPQTERPQHEGTLYIFKQTSVYHHIQNTNQKITIDMYNNNKKKTTVTVMITYRWTADMINGKTRRHY